MARVTVEDCLERLPNRFTLVLTTADRAKQLLRDHQPLVENEDGNKEVVTALREIAAGHVTVDDSSVLTFGALPAAAPLPDEADDMPLPPEPENDTPPEL